MCGLTAAASILSATTIQFVIPVRNKSQFQTDNLDSLSSSNSVGTNRVAASKGSTNKKVNVAPEKCRFCGRIYRRWIRHNVKEVCGSCAKFYWNDLKAKGKK